MSHFDGEIHRLCEEARWKDLRDLLLSILKLTPSLNGTAATTPSSSKRSGDESAPSSLKRWTLDALQEALVTRQGPQQWTPLMIGCVRAPLEVLALLCHASHKSCLLTDKSGCLPLHLVARLRRDLEAPSAIQILLECAPSSVTVVNAWGQTPLHVALDAGPDSQYIEPELDTVEILLKCANGALAIPDAQHRLPLHLAVATPCVTAATPRIIQLLVNHCEKACFVTDAQGNLPAHIMHKRVEQGQVQYEEQDDVVACMQTLLSPLADHSYNSNSTVSFAMQKSPTSWSQLHRMTNDYSREHVMNGEEQDSIPIAASPSPAKMACREGGSQDVLPIHMAAHYGVSPKVMEGLSQQYPEGASACVKWQFLLEDENDCYDEIDNADAMGMENLATSTLVQHSGHGSIILEHGTDFKGSKPSRLEDLEAVVTIDSYSNEALSNGEDEHNMGMYTDLPQISEEQSGASVTSSSRREHAERYRMLDQRTRNDLHGSDSSRSDEIVYRTASVVEIFECGWARQRALAAANTTTTTGTQHTLSSFLECADILFAYNIDALDSSSREQNMEQERRWTRQENRIRRQAQARNSSLPDSVVRAWSYLATARDSKKAMHSIGNILSGLGPSSVWRLTVVPRNGEECYISIEATGRTVAEEAEMRTPNVVMSAMIDQYWFQHRLTNFLTPTDALSYSSTCRQCRASGVRLLPQVPLRVTEASWDKSTAADSSELSPPKPWQRLDVLVTPDYAHTVFVSYYVDCHFDAEAQDKDAHAFGGLMVVRDDHRRLRPNKSEPWGDAVVAYSVSEPVNGSLVRLSFPHVPGRTYGLWHYSYGGPGSVLTVSDVRVRQLLHSCDPSGRSPLHMLLNSMVDHSPSPRLNTHVSMLLAAKFGSEDSIGDVPLHFALRCGVNEEVLQAIIMTSPWALVDVDKQGRTPIHAAFLLAEEAPPALGIIRALLTPPGENAIKLKDSAGRLPIHIGAERGAGEAVLRLLVDAYKDGCYRTNSDGDLPVHLLLKSGTANTTSIELLLRPIAENESICRVGGSTGKNLPLHIAAEYGCSYKVLEKLLQTCGDAAAFARPEGEGKNERKMYALDIFEQRRAALCRNEQGYFSIGPGHTSQSNRAQQAAQLDVVQADFDLRSDLIFAYNPFLINPKTGLPYRKDAGRIRRLETMIRREAEQCGENRKVNRRADLSDMAKQAWVFLCSFDNADDSSDNYAGTVRRILRGLPAGAVDVLAHVKNPKSLPTPNEFIKDCATQVCSVLIMSRLRFVGRYALHDELHPVHKSETCLVMRATDHGAADEYKRIISIYKAQEQTVEDDISDAGDTVDFHQQGEGPMKPTVVTMARFLKFADLLGITIEVARDEILKLSEPATRCSLAAPDTASVTSEDDRAVLGRESLDTESDDVEISKEAFTSFCRLNKLDEQSGERMVVLKFMKLPAQFQREKEVRAQLNYLGRVWTVVPILDDYNVDRIAKSRRRDIDDMLSLREDQEGEAMSAVPESKDELYALDILEKNASVHNFALYKYTIVMPAGDRDLAEISQHEELGILQIRQYMLQVGNALKSLHTHLVIHGDLKMANVVRFGKSLALIDFDSTCRFEPIDKSVVEYMGAGSSKFCTGTLPPEMIARIDLLSDFKKLINYEDSWRKVSEDAKDLMVLTPDDIQTISNVVKSMVAKADVARNLGATQQSRTLREEIQDPNLGLENQEDWKDILSMALITLSFDDLPFSLSDCRTVDEFACVWNRLLFHKTIWEKVRPRMCADERYAYVIKTYNDLVDDSGRASSLDPTQLPYARVKPSETIDVWGFGLLMYALCSGGSLFRVDFCGNLLETHDLARLYSWDRTKAETMVRSKVDDPLAQDLLLRILVPQEDRLPDMEAVLNHAFFRSSSDLEAQKILEKHEEDQLIKEETVTIHRMTTAAKRKTETCMERQCKILFDVDKVVIPSCVIVLPYQLEEEKLSRLSVQTDADLELCVAIGRYLLAINKTTAQLSFWLTVKMRTGNGTGQSQHSRLSLKKWVKQARSEPVRDVAARVAVEELGCGPEYIALCAEIISCGETAAQVKRYLKDAMGAARIEIQENTEKLLQCYDNCQLLYLVDEMNGVPKKSSAESPDFGNDKVYPIQVNRNSEMLQQTFLVFMNLAVMSATAREGLVGLAKLIGLPAAYGIPSSWTKEKAGLVHSRRPSSIAEFAVLQEVLRRERQPEVGNELCQLEDFFRDLDPLRTFADLRRVSDGKDNGAAIWTTESEVIRMRSAIEFASLEYRLRELKREWLRKKQIQQEIVEVAQQIEEVKGTVPDSKTVRPVTLDGSRRPSTTSRRPSNGGRGPSYSARHTSTSSSRSNVGPSRRADNPQAETYVNRPPSKKKRQKKRILPFFGSC